MEIELFELSNTWGCAWREAGNEKISYGFDGLPSSSSLWLFYASGDAVSQLLENGLGTITKTEPGAYGGQKRTILIDVGELEKTCSAYWDRQNAKHQRQQEQSKSCHYCGSPAIAIGFFDEPVCSQCGG